VSDYDTWEEVPSGPAVLSQTELTRFVRKRFVHHYYDQSGGGSEGYAIYWLTDPRDLQVVRYVGQTRSPKSRYLQHLNTARLWLPDQTPWWIPKLDMRPLYEWIRALYKEEQRLPVMVVSLWLPTAAEARHVERSYILQLLHAKETLLNVESEVMTRRHRARQSRSVLSTHG
jgi:hypothetical protein